MRKMLPVRMLAAGLIGFAGAVTCAAEGDPKNINTYLVDITGGAVSAANIVTLDSGVTTIETSQDLVVALQPLTSADRKSAFGLAITPAKTTLFPMSGNTYVSSPGWRLLGNLTLSYAQNEADISGQKYKKVAFSMDTVYFFNLKQDPVYASSAAFQDCANATSEQAEKKLSDLLQRQARNEITQAQFDAERKTIFDDRAAALTTCGADALAKANSAPWNSGRMSTSFGQGRVRGNGTSYSLGQQFNLNAQHPVSAQDLVQISLRYARKALDPDTLGQAQVDFKNSRLAALRYTYGGDGNSDLRVMAEVSNAKSSSASAFRDAFMYALGVDKKLAKGMWLEFRLGRSRANDNGTEQTIGLLSLNVAPSLFEFKK